MPAIHDNRKLQIVLRLLIIVNCRLCNQFKNEAICYWINKKFLNLTSLQSSKVHFRTGKPVSKLNLIGFVFVAFVYKTKCRQTIFDVSPFLSTLVYSRLFYSRLSTFLLSTLNFFTLGSRLFTHDSRLDYGPSTFRYTHSIQLILQRDFATFREFHLQQPTSTCACIDSR